MHYVVLSVDQAILPSSLHFLIVTCRCSSNHFSLSFFISNVWFLFDIHFSSKRCPIKILDLLKHLFGFYYFLCNFTCIKVVFHKFFDSSKLNMLKHQTILGRFDIHEHVLLCSFLQLSLFAVNVAQSYLFSSHWTNLFNKANAMQWPVLWLLWRLIFCKWFLSSWTRNTPCFVGPRYPLRCIN